MKIFIFFTILAASGLMLLASCNTVEGSRSNDGRPAKVTKQRTGTAKPYYGSNSEGSYYYATGDDTNSDYKPAVKRYDPARREVPAPPARQGYDRRKPSPLELSPIDF